MVIKIGINGFGRVGRVVFRTCLENPDIEVCAINDPAIEVDYISYLIKFDSTHGTLKSNVSHTENEVKVDDLSIKVFHTKLPSGIPWHTAGAEYVVEASGMFTNLEKSSGHLICDGVKRVIVTAPCVDVPMVILGVNENKVKSDMKVISCGSSTLYCLAPIVKILEDCYGVEEGFITSIHAMTPSLKPLDGLCLKGKHWRDHRSITQNIIPAATGACRALGRIIPAVKDRMCGLAFRVPIANVSVLDLTIRLKKHTTISKIAKDIEKFNETIQNIIKTNSEEAVSSDFAGDNHSCILDIGSSMQLKPDSFKLICWYENEYSYACRVVDLIIYSENQFKDLHPETSQICIQPEILKKNDVEQQTDFIDYPPETAKVETKVAKRAGLPPCNAKTPPARLKRVVPHPIVLKRRTEGKVTLCRVWNDDINTVRHKPTSFFHACTCAAATQKNNLLKISQERLEKIKQNSVCTRAQDRLEKVKQEFSKMVSVTENLLKKSCAKVNVNVTENNESTIKNVEMGVMNDEERIQASSKIKFMGNEESEHMFLNILSTDQTIAVLRNLESKEKCKLSNENQKENRIVSETKSVDNSIKYTNTSSSTVNSKNTMCNTNNEEFDTAGCDTDRSDYSFFVGSRIGIGSDMMTGSFSSETVRESKTTVQTQLGIKNTKSKDRFEIRTPNASNVRNNFIAKTFTNIIDGMASFQFQNALKNYSTMYEKRIENSEGDCIPNSLEDANETKAEEHPLKQAKPSVSFNEEITVMEATKVEIDTNKGFVRDGKKSETLSTEKEQEQHENTIEDKQDAKYNIAATVKSVDSKSDGGEKVVSCGYESKCDLAESGSKASSEPYKQDIYDKLDSGSETESFSGSDNALEVSKKKSEIIKISDLTNSLDDLDRLDKICKIMEISDELSDKLFSALNEAPDNNGVVTKKSWSFKDFCERVNFDEFCEKVFGK